MYNKFHRLWIKALIANVIIITVGFITGIISGNFTFFLMIAAFGMALEFALPYMLVFISGEDEDIENEQTVLPNYANKGDDADDTRS